MGMFELAWLRDLVGPSGHVDGGENPADIPLAPVERLPGPVLLAYASQTGVAEDLAKATEEQLLAAGIASELVDFYELDLPRLTAARQVLFLVSTTGDGDPPDMAEGFHAEAMGAPAALGELRYGLLALGDRSYEHFCGFGRRLDAWLLASGARPWFPRVDVDDEDAAALQHWHEQVGALAAATA